MNIKHLRQSFADLMADGAKILKTAEDGKRELSAEEKKQHDEILSKAEGVREDIKRTERQMDLERQMTPINEGASAPEGSKVSVGKDNSEGHEFAGPSRHKDFLQAVMDFTTGRRSDKRLLPYRATQGSDEQGTYSDPFGGFLVPTSVLPGVLSIGADEDPIAPLTTKIPMRTPTVDINARVDKNHSTSVSGGLIVTRRPETVDGTSSRMQFEQVHLAAHELFGLAYATESILADSPESFVAIIEAGFNDEFAAKAIDERLNGTGVGEPLGVMRSGCLVSVAKESGQGAATIVTENIDKMSARIWKYRRAVWIANQTAKPQLMALVRVVGTGGTTIPYYSPADSENGVDTLLGRPIYFSEFCKTLGTTGDIILGNWKEYLDGTYQPLQKAESIHVRFISNERTFKFWLRNDGQPWWKTPLTPKNGDTLSSFVALATRA